MDLHEKNDEKRSQRKKGSRFGYFFAGLGGAILGALVILFVFPEVGIINGNESDNTNENVQSVTNHTGTAVTQQKVAFDVTTAVTDAVDKTGDAVVGITNIQKQTFGDQLAQIVRAMARAMAVLLKQVLGRGVVYKKNDGKAYIVTNNHVIEGASELEVTLSDGTKLPAKLIGSDPWTDLAVITVAGDKVKTIAEFGKSSALNR